MGGAILQLVSTHSPANVWINLQPQITWFKKVYRRYTNFGTELIRLPMTRGNFGGEASAKLLPMGDLLHRLFVVIELPCLIAKFLNKKSTDLIALVNSVCLTDPTFSTALLYYARTDTDIEINQIFNLIESTLKLYLTEEDTRLQILSDLENFVLPINLHPIQFKSDLAQIWFTHSTSNQLTWSYLKFRYECNQPHPTRIRITPTSNISDIIINQFVFTHLISHTEIHTIHKYLSNQEHDIPIPLQNKKLFYEYGPIYHYYLSVYDTIINLVQTLATSNPINICKSLDMSGSFVDPNSKSNFVNKINGMNFNFIIHPYVNFVNLQLNQLFCHLEQNFDTLFNQTSHNIFDQHPNTWIIHFKLLGAINPINFVFPSPTEKLLRYTTTIFNLIKSEVDFCIDTLMPRIISICIPNKIILNFDRAHIPTIPDIFDLIHNKIGSISTDHDTRPIQEMIKDFYFNMEKYFIDGSCPPNNFLQGIEPAILSRMKFYFRAEMIFYTQLENFYQEVFSLNLPFGTHVFELLNKIVKSDTPDLFYDTISHRINTNESESKPSNWINKRANHSTLPICKYIRPLFYTKIRHKIFESDDSELNDSINPYLLNLIQSIKLLEYYLRTDSTEFFEITWLTNSLTTFDLDIKNVLQSRPNALNCLEFLTKTFHNTNSEIPLCHHSHKSNSILVNLLNEKNSYISQYTYYILHAEYINHIQNLKSELGHFVGTNDIIQIINNPSYSDFNQKLMKWMLGTTVRDTYDQINQTLDVIMRLWKWCLENNLCMYVYEKLCGYRRALTDKIILWDAIRFNRLDASQIVETFGIDGSEFAHRTKFIVSEYELYDILDYFLLKYQIRVNIPSHSKLTFKEWIIHDICGTNSSKMRDLLNLVPNSDFLFVLEFFSKAPHIPYLQNPLLLYTRNDYLSDVEIIRSVYGNFSTEDDILEYFMDWVLDYSMDINSTRFCDFDYQTRPSLTINKILGCSDTYIEEILEKKNCITYLIELCHKSIVLIMLRRKEIINLRNQICNILYRNEIARTAWIEKLGHFILSEVNVYSNDQIIDTHVSDWLEIFYEVSKQDGQIYGYDKMIGNIPKLTDFNFCPKESYKLVIPLIFYFNRNPISSLPMTASLNSTYELTLKIRHLHELAYKEQFAEYVDLMGDRCAFEPHILDMYIMAEYIYLTTEERNVFVSNRLDYLMEELQLDPSLNLTDRNLTPVYEIGIKSKILNTMNHGLKTQTAYPDRKFIRRRTFTTEPNFESDPNLILRQDNNFRPVLDRSGCPKLQMTIEPIPVDLRIHTKRCDRRYYFGNPSELMAVVIKPDIHTDPNLRFDESSYFFGEHQWSNYSLLSKYDLTKIMCVKKSHYDHLNCKLNSPNNFINLINNVLLRYHQSTPDLELFLEATQFIKESWIKFTSDNRIICDMSHIIILKEMLMTTQTDFDIWEKKYLIQMIHDVIRSIKLNSMVDICFPTDHAICSAYENLDLDDFILTRCAFTEGIYRLIPEYDVHTIKKIICGLYDIYNEVKINYLIELILGQVDVRDCCLDNIIGLSRKFISDPNMIRFMDTINSRMPKIPIKYLYFKNIIWQITQNSNLIQFNIVHRISFELNLQMNILVDCMPIELIDYRKCMITRLEINPLVRGVIKFNNYNRIPEDSDGLYWSAVQPYLYLEHTPSTGINIYSWALQPLLSLPTGSANLSKIDNFTGVYDIHPLIGTKYPATLHTFLLSLNIFRVMSGLNGKAWQYTTVHRD